MIRSYFNLHKKLFSIQEKVNGRWKVTRHVNFLVLKDVSFKVSEKGRQRVLKEKRKNVHGYVYGTESILIDVIPAGNIKYDPYKYSSFVYEDETPVEKVDFLIMRVDNKKPILLGANKLC